MTKFDVWLRKCVNYLNRIEEDRDMEEILTAEEINTRFQSEWILVGDPIVDEQFRVVSGRILHHSPHRDNVYRVGVALKPKSSAILFTGEMPANTAIL